MATQVATGEVVALPKGQNVQFQGSNLYHGVVDLTQQKGKRNDAFARQQAISGLAVQKTGNVLAAAHAQLGLVRLFDKTSGAALGTIAVAQPGRLAFAPNGDLWIVSAGGGAATATLMRWRNFLASNYKTSWPA